MKNHNRIIRGLPQGVVFITQQGFEQLQQATSICVRCQSSIRNGRYICSCQHKTGERKIHGQPTYDALPTGAPFKRG